MTGILFVCKPPIVAVFHQFVTEVRYTSSESVTPTLQVGDSLSRTLRERLIVEKLSYRMHPPRRGDIVVFRATEELKARNLNDDMIKKVIGLPGDRVSVQQGQVYLNGKALSKPYVQSLATYSYGPVTGPNGQYFVLGDS